MKGRGGAWLRQFALLFGAACVGCATQGKGSAPPLPGQPAAPDSDALAGDDAGTPADEGGTVDDAAAGGTCNDPLHALKAIFVLPAVPCATSTDCSSGDCCYVNGSSSTCVMQ